MRVLTIVGVALICGAGAANAQHSHQLEFGGFGMYTRYDPAFGVDQQFGGGFRLGYFLGENFGLEVDANMATPLITNSPIAGEGVPFTRGSASLVINSGGNRNILYVLGGYTRSRLGGYDPYTWLNQAHGGIGDRIFFGSRVALRLEARVYYAPGDQYYGSGKSPIDYSANAGLSVFLFGKGSGEAPEAPPIPKATRDSIIAAGGTLPPEGKPSRRVFVRSGVDWQRQWFWGAQAGVLMFKTDFDGFSAEPTFGGHWLITAKKTAMYVAYDESFFLSDRHATISPPTSPAQPGNVAFNGLRRIMMGVLAFPVQKAMQPFAGIGFSLMDIQNPVTTCTGCSVSDAAILQNAAEDGATKAFFWWMGGIDVRQGRLSLYGHYILQTGAGGFLIQGPTHTVQGGIRYTFGSSREDITHEH